MIQVNSCATLTAEDLAFQAMQAVKELRENVSASEVDLEPVYDAIADLKTLTASDLVAYGGRENQSARDWPGPLHVGAQPASSRRHHWEHSRAVVQDSPYDCEVHRHER